MAAQDPTRDIKVVREPAGYLLGRQTVGVAELDRFLADHGVSWQTDTAVSAKPLHQGLGRLDFFVRQAVSGEAPSNPDSERVALSDGTHEAVAPHRTV
jgi:hypothetical protein